MLDNFGLMEFLALALMALLLFGPERLPQMAARLGRWLASLTRYSKAFMAQWSDEALAIQDAVAEVRGIRDEILSAQQEITGSLAVAREDIEGAIGDARSTVKQLTPNPQALLDGAGATSAAGASAPLAAEPASTSGDGIAIAKSQQVLDDLLEKRAATPAAEPATTEEAPPESVPSPITAEQAAEQATGPGSLDPDKVDLSKLNQEPEIRQPTESAFDRTQRVLNKLLGKEEPVAPPPSPAEQPAPAELLSAAATEETIAPTAEVTAEMQPVAPEVPQTSEPVALLASVPGEPGAAQPLAADETVGTEQVTGAPEPAKVPTESAFEKTQRVLNKLRGIKEPAEAAPVAETPVPQPASDVSQQVSQPEAPVGEAVVPAQRAGTQRPSPVSALARTQRIEAPGFTVSYSRFEELSIQVTILQQELQALRAELQSFRAVQPQPVGEPTDPGPGGPSSGEPTTANSASAPVEEIG